MTSKPGPCNSTSPESSVHHHDFEFEENNHDYQYDEYSGNYDINDDNNYNKDSKDDREPENASNIC